MWHRANAMDRAYGAGSAQAASVAVFGGVAAKGLPPQSAQRLGCRRQARRLAGRGAVRSIDDTKDFRRHSVMEDTSDRAVCQTKDFTILSPLRGSIIAVVISCRGDPLRIRTHAPRYVTYLRLRTLVGR